MHFPTQILQEGAVGGEVGGELGEAVVVDLEAGEQVQAEEGVHRHPGQVVVRQGQPLQPALDMATLNITRP